MEKQRAGFDRNQLTGILLIAVLMVGFGWWQSSNMPESKPGSNSSSLQDTINTEPSDPSKTASFNQTEEDNSETVKSNEADSDASDLKGEEVTIENEELRLTFSTLGAKLIHAQLKKHQTYLGAPLSLIDSTLSNDLKGELTWDITLPGEVHLRSMEFEVIGNRKQVPQFCSVLERPQ